MGKRRTTKLLFLCCGALILSVCGFLAWITFFPSKIPPPEATAKPIPIVTQKQQQDTIASNQPSLVTINGAIYDDENEVYSNAHILIHEEQNDSSRIYQIDAYGRFEANLSVGTYILSASAADAVASVTQQVNANRDRMYPVRFTLPRAKQLSGSIRDEHGNPISNACIQLYGFHVNNQCTVSPSSATQTTRHYTTLSDPKGNYVFPKIWPGAYRLIAEASGFLPHRERSVRAGTENHRITLHTLASILVRVTDRSGLPVFLSQVSIQNDDARGIQSFNFETSTAGTCDIKDLLPGKYSLHASHPDYSQTEQSETSIDLDCDRIESTLILQHNGYSVSGTVVDWDDNTPVPNFQLLMTRIDDDSGKNIIAMATSDAQGQFRFESIHPDTYRIDDSFFSQSEINKDSSYRAIDNLGEKFTVTVVDRDIENLIVLAGKKTGISGRIYDKNKIPVAGAKVAALFARKSVTSDSEGFYLLTDLPIWREGWMMETSIEAYHPDYGTGSTGEGNDITYRSGEITKNVDIVLKDSIELEGRVTDAQNEPIPEASVAVLIALGKHSYPVDSNGTYCIPHVGRKDVLLVSATGYIREIRHLKYSKNDSKGVEDFVLLNDSDFEFGHISGIVLDRNGAPANDVEMLCNPMSKFPENRNYSYSTTSDDKGIFHFTKLKEEGKYYLRARTTKQPYFIQDVYNIALGEEHLVIQLHFRQIDLLVDLDRSSLETDELDGTSGILSLFLSGDRSQPAKSKIVTVRADRPLYDRLVLTKPGRYSIYAKIKETYGSANFVVDENSPSRIHITIPLSSMDRDKMFYVVGRCVTPSGEIIKEGYRIACRLLEPTVPAFEGERGVQKDPSPLAGLVPFILQNDGTYEFVYIQRTGRIFHRSIVPLSRSIGVPWKGEGMPLPGITLPDVIMPEEKTD